MIISRNWLAKYVPLEMDDDALNQALTFSGIEVEAIDHIPALPPEVVTARIISAEKLEDSEHLTLCMVDIGDGSEPRQVVCGAPNCSAGMVSVLALPGAVLGELTIKSARLRGVESHGMLCSERELSISEDHAGIIRLPEETPLGKSVNELYELPDTIFEVEITPNRPDLLGYEGIARDLSAALNLPLNITEPQPVPGVESDAIGLSLSIAEPQLCPRYTARLLADITVADSPLWLKTALIKSGLRPINNVVDITNYVMLETGHPLHAFDYSLLQGETQDATHPSIIVRRAKDKEKFMALDGNQYELDEQDLVIADGKDAGALAGVIGGKQTAISDATKRVVLESAAFQPQTVRRSSYNHKVSTDSSYRFERHQSPEMAARTSLRATQLLVELAGAKVIGDLYDAYPQPVQRWMVALRKSRISLLIGYEMAEAKVREYLGNLGLEFVKDGAWQEEPLHDISHIKECDASSTCEPAMWFAIPPKRVDLLREVDLIEELARLDGYHKVPIKTPPSIIMDKHAYRIRNQVLDYLVGIGFYETLNYSFNDPAQLQLLGIDPQENTHKLINPQSGNQALMRISLLPQLLDNLRYNLNHGERNLKLMELARLYPADQDVEPLHCTALVTGQLRNGHWQNPGRQINFFDIKGMVTGLLELLDLPSAKMEPLAQPWLSQTRNLAWFIEDKPVAQIGALQPAIADKFGIDLSQLRQELWVIELDVHLLIEISRNRKRTFVPLPRFPSVSRDLSFVVANHISWEHISRLVKGVDEYLISNVEIFDEYRGKQVPEGLRSLSLRLILQDKEKTLTDNRIDALVDSVLKVLAEECKIQLR